MKPSCSAKASFSWGKLLLSLLALAIMIAGQLLSQLAAQGLFLLGAPGWLCNIAAGALYAGLVWGGLVLLCRRGLRLPLEGCRLLPCRLPPFWVLAALLMPALAVGGLLLLPGHWQAGNLSVGQQAAVAASAVCYVGLAVGFVEEAVFRGVLMTALERRWNVPVAVLAPSVVFALLHCLGASLSPLSLLQLLAAGTLVGVLFSLVTLETGSIWCSALLHGVWNLVMIGGLLSIGTEAAPGALVNYVLEPASFALTGGDFGVEASLAAILAYTVFLLAAAWRLRRKKA